MKCYASILYFFREEIGETRDERQETREERRETSDEIKNANHSSLVTRLSSLFTYNSPQARKHKPNFYLREQN